jgi:hypothetical protein
MPGIFTCNAGDPKEKSSQVKDFDCPTIIPGTRQRKNKKLFIALTDLIWNDLDNQLFHLKVQGV